jgi:hypothetical protein
VRWTVPAREIAGDGEGRHTGERYTRIELSNLKKAAAAKVLWLPIVELRQRAHREIRSMVGQQVPL